MNKTKIICIVGPTASGKTDLSVQLALALNGEIISADSMQVYRNMPIASAVVTDEEKKGVPHHLVEFLDYGSEFSVADFVEIAKQKISQIISLNHIPIIVGGTGLFVDSLVRNITFSDVCSNNSLREELAEKSNEELYTILCQLDAEAAKDIHPNNRKRVIRALELCYGGTTKTQQNEASVMEESPYDALYIGISYRDRQKLYDRINERVDIMVSNGLEQEARDALANQGKTSKQAIGHKEFAPYIDGEITLDEAIENLKKATRHYAKRQLTWFRRNQNIKWLYADEMCKDKLVSEAINISNKFLKN